MNFTVNVNYSGLLLSNWFCLWNSVIQVSIAFVLVGHYYSTHHARPDYVMRTSLCLTNILTKQEHLNTQFDKKKLW